MNAVNKKQKPWDLCTHKNVSIFKKNKYPSHTRYTYNAH